MYSYLDGEPLPKGMMEGLKRAAEEMVFPFFLKTDLVSGKHSWEKTCYVQELTELPRHIFRLIETSAMVDIAGLPIKAFVFRELLDLDWRFKAFNGRMPVAKERRYFIRDGKYECYHPYWSEETIAQWYDGRIEAARLYGQDEEKVVGHTPKNWRILLRELNTVDTQERIRLLRYSKLVGEVIKGYWSIDYAQARDGKWYLIDMGLGDASEHPPCPYNKRKVLG